MDDDDNLLRLEFEAQVIYWRGPSPFFYAPLPPREAAEVQSVARAVTYGWGSIPVRAAVNGGPEFKTSLFPKDGTYLLPLKDAVRRQASITAGDRVAAIMTIAPPKFRL